MEITPFSFNMKEKEERRYEMSFFELNIHVFRMINDLGKQYTYLNPTAIFIAE